MFKETKGLEYTLEILRVLHKHGGEYDSKAVCRLIESENRITVSTSYVQKVLPRMAKIGLVNSSGTGYTISRPIEQITTDMVLGICDMPINGELLHDFCKNLRKLVSTTSITKLYDFN